MVLAMKAVGGVALLAGVACGEVFLKETFSDADWRNRWVDSNWKDAAQMGEWEWSSGAWPGDAEKDKGLRTKDKARFYGISHKLAQPFSNRDKDLVVQFSVKNEGRTTSFCGGGYIKLLGKDIDQSKFGGDTPYSIMFGPDLCGYDVSRIHLIFNYKGENLLKKEDIKIEYAEKNEYTHLYTLHLRPDNTYTVYLDLEEKSSGKITEGWAFPSEFINDPEDTKPADWEDEEMIADPAESKPEGWDDIPAEIPDPEAARPDDWDDEDDGEWAPPLIPNPEFKGEWKPSMIKNPAYKGVWKPKQIPNPDYVADVYAFDDLGSVGFELWIVDNGSIFDNIFIGDNIDEAKAFAKETFEVTKVAEKAAKEAIDAAAKEAAEEAGGEEEEAGDMPDFGDFGSLGDEEEDLDAEGMAADMEEEELAAAEGDKDEL